MRVALVIQHVWPDPGGAELQAWTLAQALAERLGGCDLITSRHDPALPREERVHGVRIVRLRSTRWSPLRRVVNGLSAFAYFLHRAPRYDVVHGHCLSLFVLGALLATHARGRPVVLKPCTVGPNGDVARVCRRAGGGLLWRVFASAERFLVESSGVARDLIGAGVAPSRVVTLPNIPCRRAPTTTAAAFDPGARATRRREARRALGLPERLTYLFVGRLVPGKGLEVLRAAFEIVAREIDASLVVVGDGPEHPALVEWARRPSLAERVWLFGWQHDPEPFFQASDVLAHASLSEAFANVLLEAMFAGLAIVTPPVGLAPDHLEEGESALFVPTGDAAALAAALLRLARDGGLRAHLGESSRRLATRAFDAERNLDLLLAELDRVTSEHRAPGQAPPGSAEVGQSPRNLSS